MQKKSAHKAAQLWKPRTTRRASLEERAQRGAHPGKRAQRGATLEAAHSEVRIIKKGLNPRLEIEGVLLTMFDGRTNLSIQVAQEVKRHFPGKVYASVIPRNVRLSEAPSHGKPVIDYDPYSKGAMAYRALAEEAAERGRL